MRVVKHFEEPAADDGGRRDGENDQGRPRHCADLDAEVGEGRRQLVGRDVMLRVEREVDSRVHHCREADPTMVDQQDGRRDLGDEGEEIGPRGHEQSQTAVGNREPSVKLEVGGVLVVIDPEENVEAQQNREPEIVGKMVGGEDRNGRRQGQQLVKYYKRAPMAFGASDEWLTWGGGGC